MTSFSFNKFMDLFKNMKSDAVPRAPRPKEQVNSETRPKWKIPNRSSTQDTSEDEEEIVIEPEEVRKNEKKKKNKPKSMNIEDDDDDVTVDGEEEQSSKNTANIQATGPVISIMACKHVRLGNDFFFGPVTQAAAATASESERKETKPEKEDIEKDNQISLLMEAKIKPDYDYMDYVAKNLGKNWQSFFRSLNFSQGKIQTAEINAAGYDISEARYKLLLDWVNNDDDGTLGRLATLLWEEGERSIVKELSLMYKKTRK